VLKTFIHDGLLELWTTGKSRAIRTDLHARVQRALDVLHRAQSLRDLDSPGFRVHPLKGTKPLRHALSVNGPWRLTFEWRDGDAYRVDLEQYH
jgi:proteic killer suppression protein